MTNKKEINSTNWINQYLYELLFWNIKTTNDFTLIFYSNLEFINRIK